MHEILRFLDAETSHNSILRTLELLQKSNFALECLDRRYQHRDSLLSQEVAGLKFLNPIGLAAGWDKNAQVPQALVALGFGFLELGTVTLEPEKGNPRPRIWRNFKEEWILNRVGFANEGAQKVLERLKNLKRDSLALKRCILGLSLGKNIASNPDQFVDEITQMIKLFNAHVDFFSVNISSPNTPERLFLEKPEFLSEALKEIKKEAKKVFVKIGPVASDDQLSQYAQIFKDFSIDGVIATNTLPTESGGLSGRPLRSLALKTTAKLYLLLEGKIPIIGVGGILRPEDAWVRITAGARLIQIFSGFVFQGPSLIKKIKEYCCQQMIAHKLTSLEEISGVRAKEFI